MEHFVLIQLHEVTFSIAYFFLRPVIQIYFKLIFLCCSEVYCILKRRMHLFSFSDG